MCRWTWKTTWLASRPVLITARHPVLSTPCSRATFEAKAKTGAIALPSPISSSETMCRLGITRMCTGISGLMSGNAMAPSFSPSFFAGIFPATILQKTHSSMATSEELLRIQQQRHRPFVHDADLHGGAEYALPDMHAAGPDPFAEPGVQRLRHLRPRRIDESRARSLPRITEERELRNRQHASTDVDHRLV